MAVNWLTNILSTMILTLTILGCTDDVVETKGNGTQGISVQTEADDTVFVGDTLPISWTFSDQKMIDVKIELYHGDSSVATLSEKVENQNVEEFVVTTDLAKRFGTVSGYRIKVSSISDSLVSGFSRSFTIAYNPKSVIVYAPVANDTFFISKTCELKWIGTGLDSSKVKIALYHRDSLISTVIDSTDNDSSETIGISLGHFVTFGLSSGYRFKVSSIADSTIFDFSDTFAISSEPYNSSYGDFTISSPRTGDTLNVLSPNTIRWSSKYMADYSSAELTLLKGGKTIRTVIAHTVDNGNYTWVPDVNLKTGNDYQIAYKHSTYAFGTARSAYFTIVGIENDSWENNNAREQATLLAVDSVQNHLCAPSDTDWIKTSIDSGEIYTVRISAEDTLNWTASFGNGTLISDSTTDSIAYTFYATVDDTCFNRMVHTGASDLIVPYTIQVEQFDPVAFPILKPSAMNPWKTHSESYVSLFQTTEWTVSDAFGATVSIYLYKDGVEVMKVNSAVKNNGFVQWRIPSNMELSDQYQVKLVSDAHAELFVMSEKFSIVPY